MNATPFFPVLYFPGFVIDHGTRKFYRTRDEINDQAIELLWATADKCERQAQQTNDRVSKLSYLT